MFIFVISDDRTGLILLAVKVETCWAMRGWEIRCTEQGMMQLIRRILFITLVFIMIVGIIINVMGRIYSKIPIQRAIFDNIQIITFNIQRSILESVQGIKKQVLPVTAEFRGREAALSSRARVSAGGLIVLHNWKMFPSWWCYFVVLLVALYLPAMLSH